MRLQKKVMSGISRFIPSACLVALGFAGAVSAGATALNAHVGEHLAAPGAKIVTIKLRDYQQGLRRLVSDGYDIAGVDVTHGTADVVVGHQSFGELKSLGLGTLVSSKEVNSQFAPDPGYTTYAELTTILKGYQTRFPDILAMESIGKSHEGRDIWAVKITDSVKKNTVKPAVFFNAMHHAREVMTTEVALDMIEQLTAGSASNPKVQEWLSQNDIWVVPMVNPDGNNKVWTSNSMWRKNTRDGYGVDINRNYPYAWGTCNGSSGSSFADNYRGPSAASEPETKAMMGFVGRIQPSMSISFHSYSELVIYPYGCDGVRTPDRETVEGIGQQLASLLPKDGSSGTYDPGTSWELLYAVDGGDIDWYYNEYHVLPYVIEVNAGAQGFQPPISWRQKTVEKLRAGWGFMLDRMSQSGIRGTVNVDGRPATGGVVVVTPAGGASIMGEAVRTYKVKPDGTFHVVIEPGMYNISVHVGDQTTNIIDTVGADLKDLTIQLTGS